MTSAPSFRIPDHIVVRALDRDFVLVDMRNGSYFGLNDVGARIWTRLGEGLDAETIASAIADEYDIAPTAALQDVVALLEQLTQAGLITPADHS